MTRYFHTTTLLLFLLSIIVVVHGADFDTKDLFDRLLKERESGKEQDWSSRARNVAQWGSDTSKSSREMMQKKCEEERVSTLQTIERLTTSIEDEKKISFSENFRENVESRVEESVEHALKALMKERADVRVRIDQINDSVRRTNDIFSTSHLIKVVDLVSEINVLRSATLELRSAEGDALYRDPYLERISTGDDDDDDESRSSSSSISISEDEEEEHVSTTAATSLSFIDLTSRTDRVDALSREAERLYEAAAETTDKDEIDAIVDQIEDDVSSWKIIRNIFDKEKMVLGRIRDDLVQEYDALNEQIKALRETSASVRKATTAGISGGTEEAQDGDEENDDNDSSLDSGSLEASLLPLLREHLRVVTESCDEMNAFANERAQWKDAFIQTGVL